MALEKSQVNELARTLAWILKEFYDDPENVRKFEEWKQQKEKRGEIRDGENDNQMSAGGIVAGHAKSEELIYQ